MGMYVKLYAEEFKDYAELAGVFDINSVRAGILGKACGNIPVYGDFDRMIRETKPDAVIVTTVDRYHDEYIVKALEAGCDAITEKPMTIDAEKSRAILEAEKRTGRKVIVTFNCRYMPYVARVKELLKGGAIGKILNADLEWMLDRSHGADYFRRWHRYMRNSGGLLVHKATHHFDMINWWLDQNPEEVFAFGTRNFYGPTREQRGERCFTCPYKNKCEFFWDIKADDFSRRFYLEAEKEDGYFRDGCVFAGDIDIYDTMSVNVKYSGGAFLSYSLVAYSPYEGWKVSFNGTEGRLEAEEFGSGIRRDEPNGQIRLYNRRGECTTYDMMKNNGAHGGGDEELLRDIFIGGMSDPLGKKSGSFSGAMSVLIGAAANISIKTKKPVNIKELLY
ncbi:MAG: Gfo/Idh/MocA family oxidoreductase [Ruminiclostridium sp.]|nr:Gfo/Idh/MocA family oxidoreductase [Ruminiclostridium sp.]